MHKYDREGYLEMSEGPRARNAEWYHGTYDKYRDEKMGDEHSS